MTTESRGVIAGLYHRRGGRETQVSGYDIGLGNNSDFIIRRKTAKVGTWWYWSARTSTISKM